MRRTMAVCVGSVAALLGLQVAALGVVIFPHDGIVSAYRLDTTQREWDDARQFAPTTSFLGIPGHLATIGSRSEQAAVRQIGYEDRWLGLTDDAAFGGSEHGETAYDPYPMAGQEPVAGQIGAGWRWITGEPFVYQAFARGEPNSDGDENAGQMRSDGYWNDNSAGAALGQPGTTSSSLIEYDLPGLPNNVFRVEVIKHYNGVTNLDIADAVVAGVFPSTMTSAPLSALNLRDSGDDGNASGGLPVPGLVQDVDDDHFVSLNTAILDVQSAGVYTFFFNSDDGGRLKVDGQVLAEFYGNRGPHDSIAVPLNLAAGTHQLEFLWFESVGGAEAEVGYAPGAKGELDFDFRLLGDPSQGIAVSGDIQSKTFKVTLQPDFGLENGQGLQGIEAAEKMFDGLIPGVHHVFYTDHINFADDFSDRFFADNDPIPGLLETDHDRFVLRATGLIEILEDDLYTFGTRSDDDARLLIDGVVVIDDESMPGRNAFGSVFLTAGFHSLMLTMSDDGGNAELELFSARGMYTGFDAQAFRLIGDVESGGLRVLQSPPIPEPTTSSIMLAGGLLLCGWRLRKVDPLLKADPS